MLYSNTVEHERMYIHASTHVTRKVCNLMWYTNIHVYKHTKYAVHTYMRDGREYSNCSKSVLLQLHLFGFACLVLV